MAAKTRAILRFIPDRAIAAVLAMMVLLGTAGCVSLEKPKKISLAQTPISQVPVPDQGNGSGILYFGFDRRLDPSEDVRMYAPFLRYLERETGYRFKLRVTPRNGSVVEDLGTGVVQFAAIGTMSYLEAHKRYGVRALVRGVTDQKKGEYQALIITAPQSKIRSLKDLKGRSFAFGAKTSTQGHLIPRIMLKEAGFDLKDLSSYEYTGSHFETANAVMSGRFDAGGIQDTLGRELATRGLVRVIAASDYFPSSTISVAPGVPPEVVARVKKALLEFDPQGKDKEGLYHWEQSEMPFGFVEATDRSFAGVRQWAEELNLLSPPGERRQGP